MIRTGFYRVCLTLTNIVFPPLTVLILTGPGMDTLVNCFLFLLAVIPSHVHGFFISWVYFSRRHKAKKGRYPGKPHSFIYSEKINNGGLSTAEVDTLWLAENGMEKARIPQSSRNSKRGRSERRRASVSSNAEQAPALPSPSPARPYRSRSSSQTGQDYFGTGVSRTSSSKSNHANVKRHSSATRQRRLSRTGSNESSSAGQRNSQIHPVATNASGSAPFRRRPMATVRG